MIWKQFHPLWLVSVTITLFDALALVRAIAVHTPTNSVFDNVNRLDIEPRQDSGSFLRILCVGASITFGVGSTTGNGYRQDLQDMLVKAGHVVHFVGTRNSGNMVNNANEGYPGLRIDQVSGYAWNSYGYAPNVVLIHLGTNDFIQGLDPQLSATRMGAMIDQIYSAVPNALVAVSKLLPNKRAGAETGIKSFNTLLEGVVSDRVSKGKPVVIADMHSTFSLDDLGPDGTHPTDAGFHKMASVWFSTLTDAIASNKLSAAKSNGLSDTDNSNNNKCAFTSSSISAPGATQYGFGNKTAVFKGVWLNKGVVLTDKGSKGTGIFWADLNGDGKDDYVHISSDGSTSFAINTGLETFGGINIVAKTPGCDLSGVRFADMNSDGVADYICVGSDGSIKVYVTSAETPSWGSSTISKDSAGYPQANVFIADMDGDGTADYIYVTNDGTVGALYKRGASWTKFYTVFSIPDFDLSATRFYDINGDGRADVLNVAQDGTVTAWMNFRGISLVQPRFQPSSVVMKPVGGGVTSANITFGRIRGTRKADVGTTHKDGTIKLHENRGYNGIAYGEWCRYCDMTGSGSDSYLTMGYSGGLKLYENLHNSGVHIKYGQILGDQGFARADVHLADVDGDGKCDYIVVNNKTGALQWRKNLGVVPGSMSLSGAAELSLANVPRCDSPGIRFADVNGDGKADYVCISASGDVSVGINTGDGFSVSGTLFSAASDMATAGSRDSISFADIDGDGSADYLFFNGESGTISARLNTGKGQSFGDEQVLYTSLSFVGGFLRFANMNGLGRADMVNVDPLSAKAKTSSNRCTPPTPPTGIGPNPNGSPDSEPSSSGDKGGIPGGPAPDDPPLPTTGFLDPPVYPDCINADSNGTVEDVLNNASIPQLCVNTYLMSAMARNMSAALDQYQAIAKDDYSTKYGFYVKAIKASVPNKMAQFFQNEADDLFTCNYLKNNVNITAGCAPNKDQNAPPSPVKAIYWVANDWEQVYTTLETKYGIDRSWVEPTVDDRYYPCPTPSPSCDTGTNTYKVYSFGAKSDIDVPDPSSAIKNTLQQYLAISDWLSETGMLASMDLFTGSDADVIDAITMSVYSVVGAVQAMQSVADIGSKAEAEQNLELILDFLSAFLLLLPGIGEGIDAALDASIFGRLATMTATAGDVGQTIYGIVEDPSSAPMQIGGILLAGAGARVDSAFRDAATIRRGLTDDVVTQLGDVVSSGMTKLKRGYKSCSS